MGLNFLCNKQTLCRIPRQSFLTRPFGTTDDTRTKDDYSLKSIKYFYWFVNITNIVLVSTKSQSFVLT